MSFSYERYDKRWENRSRRSPLGYWVPLAVTVTIATAGLAAWVWSERRDDPSSSSDDDDLSYGEDRESSHVSRQPQHEKYETARDEEGLVARMSGAIRRSPSPQQLIDGASRRVVASVAAAGAMVGGALTSIREEGHGNDHFGDHSRWSEEAEKKGRVDAQADRSTSAVTDRNLTYSQSAHGSDVRGDTTQSRSAATRHGEKRKTVAVVLSAEAMNDEHNAGSSLHRTENAVSVRQQE